MLRLFLLILMISILPPISKAQEELKLLRQQRYDKIEYYHVTGGIGFGINRNSYTDIDISVGFGSKRNLLGCDAGIRYTMCNLIKLTKGESLNVSHFTILVSGNLNMLRLQRLSAYFGTEFAYNLGISSRHQGVSLKTQRAESKFDQNYGSLRGKLGLMFSRWNVYMYCQYNLAPQMNQKYVFETGTFDYIKLRASLFERVHFGVTASYSIPL